MSVSVSSHRVACATLFSNGDQEGVAEIKKLKTSGLLAAEVRSDGLFDYYVEDHIRDYLSSIGVHTSVNSFRCHSHPISKMLENHILVNVFSHYLRKKNLFVSCRNSKINAVLKNNKANVSFEHYNRFVHAKDPLRYTEFIKELDYSFMPALVKKAQGAEVCFIHDEVHYWSLENFQDFLGHLECEQVIYSIVYPVEIQMGIPFSLNPQLYEFEDEGQGSFRWFPDGKASGSYVQPTNPWLLTTSKTEDSRLRGWSITKLESFGAHHVFLATRGVCTNDKRDCYNDFACINPLSFCSKVCRGMRRIRSSLAKEVFTYLLALRKPEPQSAVAKIRQMSKGNIMEDEIMFLGLVARKLQGMNIFVDKKNSSINEFSLLELFTDVLMAGLGEKASLFLFQKRKIAADLQGLLGFLAPAEFKVDKVFRERRIKKVIYRISEPVLSESTMDEELNGDLILNEIRRNGREPAPYDNPAVVLPRIDVGLFEFMEYVGRLRNFYRNPPKAYESPVIFHNDLKNPMSKCFVWVSKEWGLVREVKLIAGINDEDSLRNGLITHEEYLQRKNLDNGQKSNEVSQRTKEITSNKEGGTDKIECICGMGFEVGNFKGRGLELTRGDKLKNREAWFFSRSGESYSYTGASHASRGWPTELNTLINSLGYESTSFDHCLVQRYDAGAELKLHKDNESCYPAGNSILTWNQSGSCTFNIECKQGSMKIVLEEGDHLMMPNGCQTSHRHGVSGCTNSRTSYTFRSTKVHDPEGPLRVLEEQSEGSISSYEEEDEEEDTAVGGLTKGRKVCALNALSAHLGLNHETIIAKVLGEDKRAALALKSGGVSLSTLMRCCKALSLSGCVHSEFGGFRMDGVVKEINLYVEGDHVELSDRVCTSRGLKSAMLLNPETSVVTFSAKKEYAKNLVNAFTAHETGVVIKEKLMGAHLESCEQEIMMSCGFAGSGKSHYTQTVLSFESSPQTLIISPRKALKLDWQKKVHKKHACETYEKALFSLHKFKNVVVDEIDLFPEGYLDFIVCASDWECVVVLGDPLQAQYYNQDDRLKLGGTPDIFSRLCGTVNYLMYSYRLPTNQNLFEINCYGDGNAQSKKKDAQVLVCSREGLVGRDKAYTVGESQGLSFQDVRLIEDKGLRHIKNGTMMVAMTRSRNSFMVDAKKTQGCSFLNAVQNGRRITLSELKSELSLRLKSFNCHYSPYLVSNMESIEEKLANDPYLLGLGNLCFDDEFEQEEMAEEWSAEEAMRTHLFISEESNTLYSSTLKGKEEREYVSEHTGSSDQIDDVGSTREFTMVGPLSYRSRYLDHKHADDTTFFMSVKKRLRFADYERNKRSYERKVCYGEQMFRKMREFLGMPDSPWVSPLEASEQEFIQKRAQKASKLIAAHQDRSDPDWPSNYVKIFLKQQLCTKMEKRGVDAKAGQLIACFSHSVLYRFGAIIRQSEKTMSNLLPQNWLIFTQKRFEDLDEWCKEHMTEQVGTDSDYEAFDQSQDGTILAFEVALLRYLHWPEELVEEYKELKLMIGCKLGSLQVMRFSGEFGTFFLNTCCNIAYTIMRYEITPETPIAFAGDDMFSPRVLTVSHAYDHFIEDKKIIKLVAKVRVSRDPLFCGWRMTVYGIIKDPNLLLDRWKAAIEKGNLKECMDNYALEASFGYRVGDNLYDLDIDLDAQSELTRRIIKHKHQLSRGVAEIFSGSGDVASDEEDDWKFLFH
ncbi:replicase [Arracacha virus V]|uniref:Replicase n=1 Tax=Arracacha virus V TaxID=1972716 RepID=A0A1V0JB95_9VIRU|nr:replicase [Arracacha virus V]ARD06099.1 replicase [Arracacha virus V]